jgi:hypothetical protein
VRDFGRTLLVIAAALLSLTGALGGFRASLAMQELEDEAGARIRVVHGIADVGPLDLYVDGGLALIGIAYPETSVELILPGGEHRVAVVPSGASPDAAVAAGSVDLAAGERAFVTLIGTAANANVGLFPVDGRPLEAGQSRFRVINGLADAGEVVPAFAGGEAISAPLGFGDAAEYAAVEAGVYGLDFLDAVSGAPLLSLPEAPLREGTAIDVLLVGQVADGSLQVVVAETQVEVRRPTGSVASIFPGRCGRLGEPGIELAVVRTGQGEAVGVADAPLMAQGFALAPIPFATILAQPHAVAVAPDAVATDVVSCGEIGGRLTETGALVIPLRPVERGGPDGVAVLAPALENPEATGVSIFLEAAPEAEISGATPEATE